MTKGEVISSYPKDVYKRTDVITDPNYRAAALLIRIQYNNNDQKLWAENSLWLYSHIIVYSIVGVAMVIIFCLYTHIKGERGGRRGVRTMLLYYW